MSMQMINRFVTTLRSTSQWLVYIYIAMVSLFMMPLDVRADTKQEFLRCLSEVEHRTGIDRNILLAIKWVESGRGLHSVVSKNKNTTSDIGIMQINSVWLPELKSYGISYEALLNNCVNLKVATWILYRHLKKTGDIWRAVGLYHSGTPHLNKRYRQKVLTAYQKILAVASRGESAKAIGDE